MSDALDSPNGHVNLLAAIASARSIDELKRLERLARAQYIGDRLHELVTEISIHRGDLTDPASDAPADDV